MEPTRIDGKASADRVQREVQTRVRQLETYGLSPRLAVVLIGDDPASAIYVRRKLRAAQRVGVQTEFHALPAQVVLEDVLSLLKELNDAPHVHGILVQLPLPAHLDPKVVVDAISPSKDVDGLHHINVGRLLTGRPGFIPCTPLGVMRLLSDYGVTIPGKHAVVLGRSAIVGRPMSWLMLRAHATVTTCHRHTLDTASQAAQADILISAVGVPGLVTADWIKPGAVVIDVGINRLANGEIVGDVNPDALSKTSLYTPVPGGVGPMTVAMLLSNTVSAAEAALPAIRVLNRDL